MNSEILVQKFECLFGWTDKQNDFKFGSCTKIAIRIDTWDEKLGVAIGNTQIIASYVLKMTPKLIFSWMIKIDQNLSQKVCRSFLLKFGDEIDGGVLIFTVPTVHTFSTDFISAYVKWNATTRSSSSTHHCDWLDLPFCH